MKKLIRRIRLWWLTRKINWMLDKHEAEVFYIAVKDLPIPAKRKKPPTLNARWILDHVDIGPVRLAMRYYLMSRR